MEEAKVYEVLDHCGARYVERVMKNSHEQHAKNKYLGMKEQVDGFLNKMMEYAVPVYHGAIGNHPVRTYYLKDNYVLCVQPTPEGELDKLVSLWEVGFAGITDAQATQEIAGVFFGQVEMKQKDRDALVLDIEQINEDNEVTLEHARLSIIKLNEQIVQQEEIVKVCNSTKQLKVAKLNEVQTDIDSIMLNIVGKHFSRDVREAK